MVISTKATKSAFTATPASRKEQERKSKRRSPISREVGEQRLIESTIALIRERPFSEVGVRDIAAHADINHGFVHVWFGSKHLLFMAARNYLIERLAHDYANQLAGTEISVITDPDAQLLVRLSIWLEVEGVDGIEMPQTAPLANAAAQNITRLYGMDHEHALNAARLGLALAVGHIALERTFNWGESGDAVRQQWNEVLRLLGKAHPA